MDLCTVVSGIVFTGVASHMPSDPIRLVYWKFRVFTITIFVEFTT